MIFNPPPTLLRALTVPVDPANRDPHSVAAWWLVGRADHAQRADSANLEPSSQADRASRLRWPRLRRSGHAIAALCHRSHDDQGACLAEASRA
jgi:hypothetical protein